MLSTSGSNKQPDSGMGFLAFFNPSHWVGDLREKADTKLSRYLVAKGLPTLPMKLIDRIWNFKYNDMVEFLYQNLRVTDSGLRLEGRAEFVGPLYAQNITSDQVRSICL